MAYVRPSVPKQFRKTPLKIEAVRFTGKNGPGIEKWAARNGGNIIRGVGSYDGYASEIMRINTLEGTMIAGPGNWIIRGIKGEFYPCKPDIFEATYEAVD